LTVEGNVANVPACGSGLPWTATVCNVPFAPRREVTESALPPDRENENHVVLVLDSDVWFAETRAKVHLRGEAAPFNATAELLQSADKSATQRASH